MKLWRFMARVTLSSYLLRTISGPFLVTLFVAQLALMLERLLRLMEVLANEGAEVGTVVKLMAYLFPHYLGLALPAAVFLGVLLGVRSLWVGSELSVILASGLGLGQFVRPVLWAALVLTVFNLVNFGFLQPYSRYLYRSTLHDVTEASVTLGLPEGVFVEVKDGLVLRAQKIRDGGRRLIGFFGQFRDSNGRETTVTAAEAAVTTNPDTGALVLRLVNGSLVQDGPRSLPGMASFSQYDWVLPITRGVRYGPRGRDERELDLPELVRALGAPPPGRTRADVSAELNGRLVQGLSLMFLAALAVPLGVLGGSRGGRALGLPLGIFLIILYQKTLAFGESFAANGTVPAALGLWLPFFLFAALALSLLARASEGRNTAVGGWIGRFARMARRRGGAPQRT